MSGPLPFLREFTDRPYRYAGGGMAGGTPFRDDQPTGRAAGWRRGVDTMTGRCAGAGLRLEQTFRGLAGGGVEEQITLINEIAVEVRLAALELGFVADPVATPRDRFGLGLDFRTILRSYSDHWPREFLVKDGERPFGPRLWNERVPIWELCLSN